MGKTLAPIAAACALVAASLAGCASGLGFRVDHRLKWRAPPARALIQLPLTVSWSMRSFGPAGSFAVFLDRAPIEPGKTLRAIAGGDLACQRDPTCPNADYLAQRRVYATKQPSITLTEVAPLRASRDQVQLHTVTVVLLDGNGRRQGESAWTREFRLRRVSRG